MVNFLEIEKKWQNKWEESKVFRVKNNKNKFYLLEMFPYPSAAGLHMGHALNYTIGDIYARYKRMNGFSVLYPMGYDAFGLPAENAAIKAGEHPKSYTEKSIKNFIKQQKSLGLSYDWSKLLITSSPEYYKWNQYFFLKLYEKGLIYRKESAVNWCSKCETVLANEQVHNGKCWRHGDTDVEIRQLEQWFIKITNYAEELLQLDKLEWPERIKAMQKNWIGKSFGVEIIFKINNQDWSIFTTRPDTLFGVTFLVISAQHSRLKELITKDQEENVDNFLKNLKSVSEKELETLDKEGVFTGSYAVHPLTHERIPIYAGNFVVADYATGMVMAVPAHDQRDFEFAKKYNLPIKVVIGSKTELDKAYVGGGLLVNSGRFDELENNKAKEEIIKYLESKELGKKVVNYKLRDWLVSRQRYWGTPIPMVYCDSCGIVPVKENDLPIKLPEEVKFGEGNPLATSKKFLVTKCPTCGRKARRETDTMDTFFDSSWYYFRYCDNKNKKKPFDSQKISSWLPVDQYIGGAEHACMHLIYARFFTKALRDLGFVNIDEPFLRLFNQGMLHGTDGNKMSKSLGNVVTPEEVSEKYGIDTARLFLMSQASPEKDTFWNEKGIEGSAKLINKIILFSEAIKFKKSSERLQSKLNKNIREISEDIEKFRYNLAIIKIRELFEYIEQEKGISKKDFESFLKLLAPFCPHISEELWHKLGNKKLICKQNWPISDASKINERFEKEDLLVNNLTNDLNNLIRLVKEKGKEVSKAFIYIIPNEKLIYEESLQNIERKSGLSLKIFAVNDKDKYDPENKATKAKPGKPAIFLE